MISVAPFSSAEWHILLWCLDSLVLQRGNVRRNMIVPIALDVNVDWLWYQWMTPNEQHWIYGKMLGERHEKAQKGQGCFSKEIWNDDSNKLDCSNLLSSFYAIKQNQMSGFTLRISLDRLNPSNSYFQGPPNQSLLFHLPKNGQGNASPKKVGTNKAVSTGEEKKTSLPPEPDRSVAYGNFVPWIFAWYESGVTRSHFGEGSSWGSLA